ncbi:MAG: polysaccharide deacetylase family protein [Gammaproteobacteria bacterium]
MKLENTLRKHSKRAVAIALKKSGAIEKRLEKGGVIILMFHKINDGHDPQGLTISPLIFDRVLSELKERADVVSVESLFDSNGDLIVDDKVKFAITFDDGYRDNYEKAFPILKKHNVPATIYLSYGHIMGERTFWYERVMSALQNSAKLTIELDDLGFENFSLKTQTDLELAIDEIISWLKSFTDQERMNKCDDIIQRLEVAPDQIDVSPMLSWDMVEEMKQDLIHFGSHTLTHPILSRENKETIEREVVGSKKVIEEKLGQEVTGFAYPNGEIGDYNDTALEFAAVTYQHSCTTIPGINYAGQDPYQLKRINIDPKMCTNDKGAFLPALFWAKVSRLI